MLGYSHLFLIAKNKDNKWIMNDSLSSTTPSNPVKVLLQFRKHLLRLHPPWDPSPILKWMTFFLTLNCLPFLTLKSDFLITSLEVRLVLKMLKSNKRLCPDGLMK